MTEVLTSLWRGAIAMRPPRKTMREIAREVAAERGLTVEALMSASRVRPLAQARHEAMWRMRQETPNSLPRIAQFFGMKNHTTIWHGVNAHEERRRACF